MLLHPCIVFSPCSSTQLPPVKPVGQCSSSLALFFPKIPSNNKCRTLFLLFYKSIQAADSANKHLPHHENICIDLKVLCTHVRNSEVQDPVVTTHKPQAESSNQCPCSEQPFHQPLKLRGLSQSCCSALSLSTVRISPSNQHSLPSHNWSWWCMGPEESTRLCSNCHGGCIKPEIALYKNHTPRKYILMWYKAELLPFQHICFHDPHS